MRSAAALPVAPAWYLMAIWRSGRKNSGVSSSTASARSKGSAPFIRRRLTSSATMAVAAVAAHSITSEVWNAVASTSMVVLP